LPGNAIIYKNIEKMTSKDLLHQKKIISFIEKLPFDEGKIKQILRISEVGNNPEFYLGYASLFENSFSIKNIEEKIEILNIAGYLCYKYSLLLDDVLDNKETKHTTLVLANIFLEESIKLLTSLFGLEKKFWAFWNLRKEEVFEASKLGKKMFHNNYISIEEYEVLSDSKSALGKIALDSLFILSDDESDDKYNKLIKSHYYFSTGFQINDDIGDFIEDYENQEFNFAYYKFVVEKKKQVKDIRELKKLFYISNTATDLYKFALTYFEKAYNIAAEVGENKWLDVINEKIVETKRAINVVEEYLMLVGAKASLREKAQKINYFAYTFDKNIIIEKGLGYLIGEWEKDYPEVKHIMILSDIEGFKNDKTLHVTDVFQRGILTNNLIDITVNYQINLNQIIEYEINYLVENRNVLDAECWSYFPTVKEIAPDADDLGQMMQVFLKQGKKTIVNNYCLGGVNILLSDCYNKETGGIETWIIPKLNQTENQKRQKEFNDSKWGSGPDIEVMANFLYALSIADFEKYKDFIEKGTKYIFSKIENDSFWNSRWYYGWQYGTMVCVRLAVELSKFNIKFKNKYSEHFERIRNYIVSNQNENGGWSIDLSSASDSLSTSLCLITFMLFDNFDDLQYVKKGILYLEQNQNSDGSWEAVPFIKPRLNEPYKSKEITTSYVLNALTTYNESRFVR